MSLIYSWIVKDAETGRLRSEHASVEAAFAARTPRDVVFIVLRGTDFRARVLRPG